MSLRQLNCSPYNPSLGGKFTSITVNPPSGPQGTTFTITANYILNATSGTAQSVLEIVPPAGQPLGWSSVFVGQASGPASLKQSVETIPQQGQTFPPGNYQVVAAICEGLCGGKHHNEYTVGMFLSSNVTNLIASARQSFVHDYRLNFL